MSAVADKYLSLGGSQGFLGSPLAPETITPHGDGSYQHYQHGSIYWSSATGAHEIHGDIREKWKTMGWELSALGYPETDENSAPDGIGRYQRFQHGHMYWTPATGAHPIFNGPIWEKWQQNRWEQGELGYPLGDAQPVPLSTSPHEWLQVFQHGLILQKGTDVFAIRKDGAAIPTQHYRLTLEEVYCESETGGFGSDDFWLSLVVFSSISDSSGALWKKSYRWHHEDVDTGERKTIGIVLYDDLLPAFLTTTMMGLEVDETGKARDQIEYFEEKLKKAIDDYTDEVVTRDEITETLVKGASYGFFAGALVSADLVITTSGGGFFATGGSLLVGLGMGLLGVAIAGAVLGISAVIKWLSPDLLLADSVRSEGNELQTVDVNEILPLISGSVLWSSSLKIQDGLYLKVSRMRDLNGDIIELRNYRAVSEGSSYILTFRHHLGV